MQIGIVTGATKGIGRAIVEALTADGWTLGLIARTEADVLSLCEETNCGHIPFFGDVTNSSFVDGCVDAMVRDFGHLDLMVPNAGLGSFGAVETTADSAFQTMMDTNVTGLFYCVRAAVRVMRPAKSGHIVPILSIASKKTFPNASGYVASKWAAYGFIQCVTEEVRRDGIRVSSIFPGSVDTPFWDAMGGAPWDKADLIQASDVALTVLQVLNMTDTCVIDEIVVMPPKGTL